MMEGLQVDSEIKNWVTFNGYISGIQICDSAHWTKVPHMQSLIMQLTWGRLREKSILHVGRDHLKDWEPGP